MAELKLLLRRSGLVYKISVKVLDAGQKFVKIICK